MRIGVTGASGFIGAHLVRALAASGHFVAAISHHQEGPAEAAERYRGDVCLPETWTSVASVDAVVHLAGLVDASLSFRQPLEYNAANAFGTLVGLEAARRMGKPFLLASSQRVYRPSFEPLAEDHPKGPSDPYGYSKWIAERWVEMYHRVFGLSTAILRFFSVYGPGQAPGTGASGVVALFASRALRGEELVAHNHALRDFTYVGDVASGIRAVLENRRFNGRVYNIATGVATTTEQLARLVVAATGALVPVRVEHPDVQGESYVANITRASRELGYAPTVLLPRGLAHYVDWLRCNG